MQLAYGAHHDAITGSESDQVYLDLLTGWRDAWELGCAARDNSLALLSSAVDGDVIVWNPLAHRRTDIVTARLDPPLGRRGAGARPRRRRAARTRRARRAVGHLAGARRAVAGLAGLPAGARRRADRLGTGAGLGDRQRALPAGGRPGARRGGRVAGSRRSPADRRRPGGQRARRLRGVPVAPDAGRGPVAPAAQGAGGVLVGIAGAGAGLPRPAGSAAGRARPDRQRCCATPRP